jgi:hypothetical protein
MDHPNSEVNEIANVGKNQATRQAFQSDFSEKPQASFVRHGVCRDYPIVSSDESYVRDGQRA